MVHHKISFGLILLSFISISQISAQTQTQTPDLVIEVFRHGARGPLNQTFDPTQYWGDNVNQLTPAGMRMHYLLGAAIQNKYSELLASYDPTKIYIRSTDVNRTIMSAYSHLYGVYDNKGPGLGNILPANATPSYSSPYINEVLANLTNNFALPDNLQVVPVHVVQEAQDYVLASYAACPLANDWSDSNAEDSESNDVFSNDLSNVTAYLQSQNLSIQSFWDLFYAGDNAICNLVQQIELPGNVQPFSQNYYDLKFAFEWFTAKLVEGTPIQVELYALNLLNTISDYMNAVLNGTSSLEFVFLSAHDTTLMTLLSAFGTTTKDCLLANYRSAKENNTNPYPNCIYPQFASNLIFEFYTTPEPYVVFYYNGSAVPFCGNSNNTCTFTQFQSYISQITNGYTLNDYLELCQFPDTILADSYHKSKVIITVLSCLCGVLFIGLLFAIYKVVRKSKELTKKEQLLQNQAQQETTMLGRL